MNIKFLLLFILINNNLFSMENKLLITDYKGNENIEDSNLYKLINDLWLVTSNFIAADFDEIDQKDFKLLGDLKILSEKIGALSNLDQDFKIMIRENLTFFLENLYNKFQDILKNYFKNLELTRKNDYLILFSKKNDLYLVKILIDNFADVNYKTNYGRTPLIIACQNGNYDLVKLLILNRADINLTDDYGRTALIYACIEQYEDIVKILIENNADINIADNFGKTVLLIASESKNLNILKLIIEKDPNIICKTILQDKQDSKVKKL